MRLATSVLLALGLGMAPVQAAPLTVVELFTSQGCSSCPPANANLASVASRPDVLALSFGVTYWDYLGWKDTFAKSEFTNRQVAYEPQLGHGGPFTPQIVVNGVRDTVGNVRSDVERLIVDAHHLVGPRIEVHNSIVSVAAAAATDSADVWLVRYEPRTINVSVARGENGGVTLPHRNVVRELTRLGTWSGRAAAFPIVEAAPGLATAILVQQPHGGAILGAWRS